MLINARVSIATKAILVSIMVTSNQTFSIKHLNNNFCRCMTDIKAHWLIISVIMCNVGLVFLYF